MYNSTSLNNLGQEGCVHQDSLLEMYPHPVIVNAGLTLPSLNTLALALVPTGQQIFGVFEVHEETPVGYQTQADTPLSRLPLQTSENLSNGHKVLEFGEIISPSDFHTSQKLPQYVPYFSHFEGSKHLGISNIPKEQISQQSVNQVSIKNKPACSQVLKKDIKPSDAEVLQCEGAYCSCGLNQKQSSFINKVMTSTNMRFLTKLMHYEYTIEEDEFNSNNKGCKFICKFKGGCNKEFTRPWNLLDHCRMHRGVKPFGCYICGKKFTQKGNRNKHIQRHK